MVTVRLIQHQCLPVLIEVHNDNKYVTQLCMYYRLRAQNMASVCTAMQMHKLCKAEQYGGYVPKAEMKMETELTFFRASYSQPTIQRHPEQPNNCLNKPPSHV